MNTSQIALMLVDVAAIVLLFWKAPELLARLVGTRFSQSAPRPLVFVYEQLPGIFFGTALGALFLYLTGFSYEQMIVDSARSIGETALSVFGMDQLSICTARVIEEHFTTDAAFRDEATKFAELLNKPTWVERDQIIVRGGQLIMAGEGGPGLLQRAAEFYCRKEAG